MKVSIRAFAKVNLFLDITGTNGNGYHLIDTVMQSVSLCDEITVSDCIKSGITIECDVADIPCDESNIAYKTANEFFSACPEIANNGIKISIKKHIPHEAGLGGGSADAAGVLAALNKMFGNLFSEAELCRIGSKIGADVPFCIVGGTKRAQGIGEKLSPLPAMPNCYIVIVKPNFGVSTKKAYSDYDSLEFHKSRSINMVLHGLELGCIKTVASGLDNAFEDVVPSEKLERIKHIMFKNGAYNCLMSGSGSAVFGIFNLQVSAEKCLNEFKNIGFNAHLAKPVDRGFFMKTE